MKRKKLISTSLLFLSLLIAGSSLVGCNLLARNTNDSTDSTGSDEDPTDTTTPTDPTDPSDSVNEDPTTPTDPTDPSDLEPDPESTTYNVTYTSSSDYTVSGLADSYVEGATVSFTITITNNTKELVSVAYNNNLITAIDGAYSFIMPASDVTISITTTNKSYAVTYVESDDYTINIENGATYEYETTVSFMVTSKEKYINSVSISAGTLIDNNNNSYSFIMPASDVTITVKASSYSNEYMETYGYENALIEWDFSDYGFDGIYYHRAPEEVAYYIDPSVTDNYLTAVYYAIDKANQLTDAFNITTTTNRNSNYVFKVAYLSQYEGAAGLNELGVSLYGYDDYITDVICTNSTIYFNTLHTDNYTLSDLKYIAMHELGHTFGLLDLYGGTNPANDVSIMGSTYSFDDYTEFDRLNIDWWYDS